MSKRLGVGWLGWEWFASLEELLQAIPTAKDVIAHALTPDADDPEELWTVEIYSDGIATVVCRPIKQGPDAGWIVKAYAVLSYDAPVRTNCPVGFLELAPDRGGESTLWRLKVQLGEDAIDTSLPSDGAPPRLLDS